MPGEVELILISFNIDWMLDPITRSCRDDNLLLHRLACSSFVNHADNMPALKGLSRREARQL